MTGTVLYDPQRYPAATLREFRASALAPLTSSEDAHATAAQADTECPCFGTGNVTQLVLVGVHAHNRFTSQVDGDASIAAVREVRERACA